jgi:acyl carrier protein
VSLPEDVSISDEMIEQAKTVGDVADGVLALLSQPRKEE